ncbi:MAG TPA: hypothetical protein VEM13_09625 [Gemmatimonadales bacterium]|nr:hypothetical protein [Gemmatimonadales bacterium]
MTRGPSVVAVSLLLLGGPLDQLTAQCPDGSPPPCARLRLPLDTARYVILPFTHREGSQSQGLDGADCAEFLTEAFERWTDVRLADKARIYDALQRRGAEAPFRIAFDTGLTIARQLGAGKLVMGQVWSFGDTLRLTASLYDAAPGGREAPLRQATARVPAHSGRIGGAFNELANALLGAAPSAEGGAGAEQTQSLRALGAYTLGARAIRAWDLVGAVRQFRTAVAADSDFARAHLWLGQALLWGADSTTDAMRDRAAIARRARGLLERLGPTDRSLLLAQQAMFERRWPDACRQYREMLATDSTSFAAWYGLAECNTADPVVVRDPQDSGRFVFRGSWHTATLAYRNALLLAPAFNFALGSHATARLEGVLIAEMNWWRTGQLDTLVFYAFPEFEAETLAFHPVSAPLAATLDLWSPAHVGAVARNRRMLVELTAAWASAFPEAPRAHRALAHALEVSGNLAPTLGEPRRSALTEIQEALQHERAGSERARDLVTAVRLLVKAGEFDAARRAGDSLLRAAPRGVAGVAGVAVLLGRPSLAARLVAPDDPGTEFPSSADNRAVRLPVKAVQAGLALLAYAAAGGPRDSVAALERRVERLADAVPASARPGTRSALLDVAAELMFPDLGLRPAHRVTPPGPHPVMAMQWALGHGDTAAARAALDAARNGRHGAAAPPEDAPPDGVYLEALGHLAVGDTASAVLALDAPLNALPSLHTALFRYLPLPGALVRMMALRAELAATRGEPAVARRWATAVVALWSGADPALQPTVARMSIIAKTAH